MFPGGYNHSVKVNGTEYTVVAVPLICMAAGLQDKIAPIYILCVIILYVTYIGAI